MGGLWKLSYTWVINKIKIIAVVCRYLLINPFNKATPEVLYVSSVSFLFYMRGVYYIAKTSTMLKTMLTRSRSPKYYWVLTKCAWPNKQSCLWIWHAISNYWSNFVQKLCIVTEHKTINMVKQIHTSICKYFIQFDLKFMKTKKIKSYMSELKK